MIDQDENSQSRDDRLDKDTKLSWCWQDNDDGDEYNGNDNGDDELYFMKLDWNDNKNWVNATYSGCGSIQIGEY